ncbi:hypothetical protein [Compostimonas suwonensis]|uniref:Uncharacterized protein n=1 Tax=Compostimonas suwonensis TaxID=1048394 RepID=A0A2M9C4E7_9MICO|nr:hypothetical protein [Compostimonas suwonensis]PJJ65404.1 hypothetical protein CLV54_0437 [Compostimonas suwonensis]
MTLGAGVALAAVLTGCSGAPLIALLEQPQHAIDRVPIFFDAEPGTFLDDYHEQLSGQSSGVDIDSTRFLADYDGLLYYVGTQRDPSGGESICVLTEPSENALQLSGDGVVDPDDAKGRYVIVSGTPSSGFSACGAVRYNPLMGGDGESEFALVRDGYDVAGLEAQGWMPVHPNLLVRARPR